MKTSTIVLLLFILVSNSFSQNPCPDIPTVDYAGKTYNTVQIGYQCWLKENLDVGTKINGSGNQTDNNTIEKYCYNDDPANCLTYGGLYQWSEVMQYSTTPGTQGICPSGWHLPTLAEFETLKAAVNNDGNALKAIGQGSGSGAGTNTSGFSALLGGDRNFQGDFSNIGTNSLFWSSTEDFTQYSNTMILYSYSSNILLDINNEDYGFSVRCIYDNLVPVELQSFMIKNNGQIITINWTTVTETNNQGFEIFRNDSRIAFIPGKGTTTEKQNYKYTDIVQRNGLYIYKLVQIDYDGTKEEVALKNIYVDDITKEFKLDQNYPNPFNPACTISFSIPEDVFVKLKVFDVLGNEVASLVNELKEKGNYDINFDGTYLTSGVYFYTISAGEYTETKRMILIK